MVPLVLQQTALLIGIKRLIVFVVFSTRLGVWLGWSGACMAVAGVAVVPFASSMVPAMAAMTSMVSSFRLADSLAV